MTSDLDLWAFDPQIDGILGLAVRKRAENLDRQTAAGYERCRDSHQRQTKIRPRSDAISTSRSTQRITFKLCLLVFKFLHGLATALSCRAMCTGRRRDGAPQSALCNSRTTKFSRYNMTSYGRPAFSYAGPHA